MTRFFKSSLAIVCSCFLLIIMSCAPVTITPQTHSNITPFGRITYIRVENVKTRKEGEQLQAFATLLNSHRKNETLYYRFKWLDSDGIPLGDEPVWKTQLFHGEQSQIIKGTTQNPKAVDFKLELASDKAKYLKN